VESERTVMRRCSASSLGTAGLGATGVSRDTDGPPITRGQ
jgi:hypothetical protein